MCIVLPLSLSITLSPWNDTLGTNPPSLSVLVAVLYNSEGAGTRAGILQGEKEVAIAQHCALKSHCSFYSPSLPLSHLLHLP